jgi:hypothetical protein
MSQHFVLSTKVVVLGLSCDLNDVCSCLAPLPLHAGLNGFSMPGTFLAHVNWGIKTKLLST